MDQKPTPNSAFDALTSTSRTNSVRPAVLAHIAFRNLGAKKLRTALTVSGVVIGVGAIVFLISLGFGLQGLVSRQVVDSSNVKTIDVTVANSKSLRLTSETVGRIRQYDHVVMVAKTYASGGNVSLGGARTDSVVYSADAEYLTLSSLRLAAGQSLNLQTDRQALVNKALLSAIGLADGSKALGQTLSVNIASLDPEAGGTDRKPLVTTVEIVGVLETGAGAEIFVRDSLFAAAGAQHFSQLKVVVDKQEYISEVRKKIDALGFTTISPIDTLGQINQIFRFFNFILAGFGGIGMTIAILGMFNTLTISLLERTREIGLMVSLGARRRDIRRLFIIEALCLSFGGGIIGIAGAILLGQGVNFFLTQLAASRGVNESISVFSTPALFIIVVLGFIGAVGLLVVYHPARRAERISPIDALRRE